METRRLTGPPDPKKHSNANKIYQLQIWIKGENGIPEAQKLVKGKLSAK